MKNPKRCSRCGKKYHGTKKEYCRICCNELGLVTRNTIWFQQKRRMKSFVASPQPFITDIKILATKFKWNLLSPIDLFKIVNIWLKLFDANNGYDRMNLNDQISKMIADLKWSLDKEPSNHESKRKIIKGVVLWQNEEIVKTWTSVKKCSEDLEISTSTIRMICDGKRTRFVWDLRYI